MAELEDQDPYQTDVQLSIGELVESYHLPQRVKVTDGYYDSNVEFANGDCIDLREASCDFVTLTFFKSTNINKQQKSVVPVDHPAKFQSIPIGKNHKYCASPKSISLKFNGVTELAKYCPLFVQVTKTYQDPGHVIVEKGDRLSLLRFVRRCGIKFLECKSVKQNRLIQLKASDNNGEFQEVKWSTYFTISELVTILPRTRRLTLVDDVINTRNPLPGLPKEWLSDLVIVLEKPQLDVKVSPVHSPGTVYTIPHEIQLTVSPREETYQSRQETGMPLRYFARDNQDRFPTVALITDWDEQGSILENNRVRPGMNIILHKEVDVGKWIAHTKDDQYFAIPEDYNGLLCHVPPSFTCIAEANLELGYRFKALEDAHIEGWKAKTYRVVKDVIYEVVSKGTEILQKKKAGVVQDEIEVITVNQVDPGAKKSEVPNEQAPTFKLPLALSGKFQHYVPEEHITLRELFRRENRVPIKVRFVKLSDDHPAENQRIPLNTNMTLDFFVREPCITTTTESLKIASGFNLPLRTPMLLVNVKSTKEYKRPTTMSPYESCPEVISKELPEQLRDFEDDYVLPEDQPPLLPARVSTKKTSTTKPLPSLQVPDALTDSRKPVPVPRTKSTSRGQLTPEPAPSRPPKSPSVRKGSVGAEKGYSARRPPAPPPTEPEPDEEDEEAIPYEDVNAQVDRIEESDSDYEEVFDSLFSNNIEPDIVIPKDGNLLKFNVDEMLAFMKTNNVPVSTLFQLKRAKIDGAGFAKMTPQEMKNYKLDVHPIVMHFKNATKSEVLTML